MKKVLVMIGLGLLSLLLCTPSVSAQSFVSSVDFSELEAVADEVVDITLDKSMLRIAAKFLEADGEEREIRDLIDSLQGVYVKHFTFEEEWVYDKGFAERIRSLVPVGFERLVQVRSRSSENVDVFVRPYGDEIDGLIIIAAEPNEFTVVNIVGRIDITKLGEIDGHFGIPDLDLEMDSSSRRRDRR